MHRNVGLDWAQDSLRVATLQSGFRGFALQDVRSALLLADRTPAERLRAGLAALDLTPPLVPDGEAPLTAALLYAGPERADLVVLDAGRPVLARALAASNAAAWTAAITDPAARERLLSLLARDLKISLRSRNAAPQRLLLAGAVASLPEATEPLSAETHVPAQPLTLPAGDPRDAMALGPALPAPVSRGRGTVRQG